MELEGDGGSGFYTSSYAYHYVVDYNAYGAEYGSFHHGDLYYSEIIELFDLIVNSDVLISKTILKTIKELVSFLDIINLN